MKTGAGFKKMVLDKKKELNKCNKMKAQEGTSGFSGSRY